MARNNRYKQPDSFDPSFNMMDQKGAFIAKLFNSNSILNSGFIYAYYKPYNNPITKQQGRHRETILTTLTGTIPHTLM